MRSKKVKRHKQNFYGFSFVLLNRILSKVTNILIRKKNKKNKLSDVFLLLEGMITLRGMILLFTRVFFKSQNQNGDQCPVSSQFLHDTCFSFIAAAEIPDSKWYTFANGIRMHWALEICKQFFPWYPKDSSIRFSFSVDLKSDGD